MSDKPTEAAEDILGRLRNAEVITVATRAGERIRTRMMHFAAGPDLSVYLASMKGDPKTLQITHHPAISLLLHVAGSDVNDSSEVEITGRAVMVRGEAERREALEATAVKSPVVKYMLESGNAELLDCIKVVPEVVKLRVFREIVQGKPPTVLTFGKPEPEASDWALLSKKISAWRESVRPLSLTASLVPLMLGTAVASLATGTLQIGLFLWAMVAGVAIQAATNLWNDYFDHRSGNDEANREFVRPFSGGSRVIQLGLLSGLEVLTGAILLSLLSVGIGIYLTVACGPFLLLLGAFGLLSGIFYTGRPFEWASRGFGEALVGLNYGILMTVGAYYVQTGMLTWAPVIAALPVAVLVTAVLYINEFPDYIADSASRKRTLIVRLGRDKAAGGFGVLFALAYICLIVGVVAGSLPFSALLGLITVPLAVRATLHASRHHSSPFDLAPANALTAISHLGLGLALTLAFAWQGTGTAGLGYVVVLAVLFAVFVGYFYRQIERQRLAFQGLKGTLT